MMSNGFTVACRQAALAGVLWCLSREAEAGGTVIWGEKVQRRGWWVCAKGGIRKHQSLGLIDIFN